MTIKSVWHTNLEPVSAEGRSKKVRIRDDLNVLTSAHEQIEIVSNHFINQSFGNFFNHVKSTAELREVFPDLFLFAEFSSVRDIKDSVFSASQNICIDNISIRNTVHSFFDKVRFPHFKATRHDCRTLTASLKHHKETYIQNSSFPTLENGYELILTCNLAIISAFIDIQNRSFNIDTTYSHSLPELANFYADALRNIEHCVKVDDLFKVPTRKSGISFVDNAHKILDNALKIQAQAFVTREVESHLNGDIELSSIFNIQKGHCMDTLNTLQEYYDEGLWGAFFEDIAANLASDFFSNEPSEDENPPPINEMVGIAQFLIDFRMQGVNFHSDIYQGDILTMADSLTQQTLNICAQMLAVEKPNTLTHTIKLGRH